MKNDNSVKSKNAFVKAGEQNLKSMMGDRPKQNPKSYKFNAFMSNNGEGAMSFGEKLTKGLDKKAFPVK